MMEKNKVISVECISKFYPTEVGLMRIFKKARLIRALKSVSFNVYEEEVFGILGPNGAGKTTLIKILATLVLADTGKTTMFGYDVKQNPYDIKNKIGIITGDERGFYWRLTGRENLMFFGTLSNLSKTELKKKIPYLLDFVKLTKSKDIMFKEYSSGMKTRLQLARALLTKPEMLLLDEPTKSLDIEGKEKFKQLLKEPILGKKPTVILATHSLEEAEAVCDRYMILKKGEKVIEGDIEDIRNFLKLSNHITISFSARNTDDLKLIIKDIKNIKSLTSIEEKIIKNTADLNIRYKENPVDFLTTLIAFCKNVEGCEVLSLNVNSKDLKEIMHLILDIKKV